MLSTPKLQLPSLPHLSFSPTILLHSPFLFVSIGLFVLMALSSIWRTARALFALVVAGGALWALYEIANAVNRVVGGTSKTGWITMPSINGGKMTSLPILKTQTLNVGVMLALLIVVVAVFIFYGAVKSSGYSMGYVMNRLWVYFTDDPVIRGKHKDVYTFPNVTIGVGIGEAEPRLPGASEKAGKQIEIKAKDRFLNMGIIGPIGSGKTFMTMKPQIYQDLENISQGVMANMLWISPQPEPSVEKYAESLGIKVRRIHIIDGQMDGKGTNIRFNPLFGDNIDAVISNVNIMLNEQTGDKAKGAAFFDDMAAQATTDSLQLYKYLYGFDEFGNPVEIDMIGWYDRYLVQMNELFFDAVRVQQVSDLEQRGQLDRPLSEVRGDRIRQIVWPKLAYAEKMMLRRAAVSIITEFDGDVDGKNAEAYKNIIRGLRGKVRVLISSQYVQELLGRENEQAKDRPNFAFESWIDPPEWIPPKLTNPFPSGNGFVNLLNKFKYHKYIDEQMQVWKTEAPTKHKGELLSVITGQTDTGKLVGRMVLVFEQQAVLNRPGKDNDKPPVYCYVDEYPSYATRSINEIRTQGRKHCHGMVMAHQSRGQMDDVARNYRRTLESSTRHWVYLSNLGFEDAEDVSKMCGKVKRIKTNTSTRQVRMSGLGKDDGGPLVTKSEQEEMVARFSSDFIRYDMGKNEVIYIGVDDRQGQRPLRMRIVEPRENKTLIKKAVATPGQPAKSAKKRPYKVSAYPPHDIVAKVKWPILTFGHKTLYVYRWGMTVERDAYTDKVPVDPNERFESAQQTEPEPKLLKDIFDENFFNPNEKNKTSEEDDIMEKRVRKIKTTFGKQAVAKSEEDHIDPPEQTNLNEVTRLESEEIQLCKQDGTPLNKKVVGDTIRYVCPTCCARTYQDR